MEKAIELNEKLAFMNTSTYASDKLYLIREYKDAACRKLDLRTPLPSSLSERNER